MIISKLINFIKSLFRKKETTVPDKPGLIESPTDFRDIPLSAIKKRFVPLPKKYRIPYVLNVKNQGHKPHCVGYSCATLKEFLERREGNNIQFDGDWIYRECKKIDGIPDFQGTYFRSGLKVLQKVGAMPVGGGNPDKYRIGGYVRVDTDFESLKQAIYEFGAILIGFIGSNGGWKTAFIRKPKSGETQWGHAIAGIGYEITYVDGQNSFGENWGDEGLFHFAKDYRPIEAWAVPVDLPNDWKELLGKDKEKPKYFFKNNLWHGLKGEEVKILQDSLKFFGCMNPEQSSTGWFGPMTLNAVKSYQIRKNIQPVLGYFGSLTRTAMNKDLEV